MLASVHGKGRAPQKPWELQEPEAEDPPPAVSLQHPLLTKFSITPESAQKIEGSDPFSGIAQ